ncbi:hypothetical protein KR222_008233 [Zaprionus bogoriensis]|nr:hypothetical protein KR222_008233 [Zaprionus bogoriensis]
MCFLSAFLCCLPLYYGCIFIGFLGVLNSILSFVWMSFRFYGEEQLGYSLVISLVLLVYFFGKVFLVIGLLWDFLSMIMMAFVFGAVALVAMFVSLLVWTLAVKSVPANASTAIYFTIIVLWVLVEMYYLWIIISYHAEVSSDGDQ